jgi:methionyl-tRNA formyltransferase
MKVVILTSIRRGMASLALPALLRAQHEVAAVVFCEAQSQRPGVMIPRRLQKITRIGVLGALNGIRIRPWFSTGPARRLAIDDIQAVAARHGVAFHVSPGTNAPRTVALVEEARCDLGLSLGNGYISKRVFSTPRLGMINIHHELLPAYPGAQSVLWQIRDGSSVSGYTIHQVRAQIDKGEILYRETLPIAFEPKLRDTVVNTCAMLYQASVDGLVRVLNEYPALMAAAETQPPSGRRYTTPTWREFRDIVRQHQRLSQASRRS